MKREEGLFIVQENLGERFNLPSRHPQVEGFAPRWGEGGPVNSLNVVQSFGWDEFSRMEAD